MNVMMIRVLFIALIASSFVLPLAGCASQTAAKTLKASITGFNADLRWKRFNGAANFLPAEERSQFLEHYLSLEKDLFIQSLEVKNVDFQQTQLPSDLENSIEQAQVLVMAEYYILPSTVVKRQPVTQNWEYRNGSWKMVRSNFDFSYEPPISP